MSGPPPTLRTLFSSEFTPGTKQTAIPVFGPYHASHLHSKTDIEKVLRLDDFETYQIPEASVPQYPIISSTTGSQYEDTNFRSLLVSVVHDILNEPLRFDRALDGCISKAQNYKGTKCLVIPFGPTYVASTLATKLKAQTDHEIILGQSPSLLGSAALGGIGNHGSSGRCKLAIVGMAGRFPDAATHEKLWELLEKGVDAHRVVSATILVLPEYILTSYRFQEIASLWRLTSTQQARRVTRVTPHMVAGLRIRAFLTPGSLT